MKVEARVSKNLRQIRIVKRGTWDSLMTVKDAQKAYEAGKIDEHNKVFARLVENDFDIDKTLAYYAGQREKANKIEGD